MDGFITRRPQRSLLNERSWQKTDTTVGHMREDARSNIEMHTGDSAADKLEITSGEGVKHDIGQSLMAIDTDVKEANKKKKKKRGKRKVAKITSIIIGAVLLLVVGFLVYKAWQIGSKVFQGNLMGIFQQQELKMDEFGRSNVLILGSTDDMAGRDGATLTDSMMVVSVDQKKKDAYMFSVPRDLWVKYNQACFTGYEGKINAFYMCADEGDSQEAETARMDATKELVGNIFNMDIQYVVHVNTVVIRDGVSAVGGITVNVDSEDERGVLDSTFDDMCRDARELCPRGHFVDFTNGPNDMNGDQAMAFSQARGMGALSYGLSGSNFDREKNQQLVLMALKNKATSTGTLTDITKVMSLMDAMGDNLRTNIDPKELQTIMKLGAEIQESDIHRLSFYEDDNRLLTTGMIANQSTVYPVAGPYDYSDIRKFIKSTIYATPLTKEGAKVAVLNGGAAAGVAQKEADALEEQGITVTFVGNAPEDEYGAYTIYAATQEGMPLTRAKLEELYATKTSVGKAPFSVLAEADFVVIIGADAE